MAKEDFFSNLKNKCPRDDDIQRTEEIIKKFVIKNGEELKKLYLKSHVIFLADVFEKLFKTSIEQKGINPLFCVSIPGYTWQCTMKYTNNNSQKLQDKNLILTSENNTRGGIGSIMGDRCVKSNDNKKILFIDANNLNG